MDPLEKRRQQALQERRGLPDTVWTLLGIAAYALFIFGMRRLGWMG